MDEIKYINKVEDIKAFSDPYRYEILKNFYSLGKPATVKQIADEMKEVPAKVHYHVKKLLKAEILALDHTEEIKGIIAKYYYPTAKAFKVKRETTISNDEVLSETAVMCSNILDSNKNIFLEALKSTDNKGSLSSEYIYLTQEEYDNLIDWIGSKFNQLKHNKDNRKKYLFFTGVIGIDNKQDFAEKED